MPRSGDADAPRDGDTLWLALPANADQGRIRDAAQAWLQQRAGAWFGARLAHFLQISGLKIRRWRLSSAATRWGSCTSDGNIMLNWRLIHFAPAIIDYVIAHELAHLREMNHSQDFWREVARSCPISRTPRTSCGATIRHPCLNSEAPWRHDDAAADSRPGDHRRTGEGCRGAGLCALGQRFPRTLPPGLRRRAARRLRAARRTCRAGLARLRSLRCRGRDPHAGAARRTPAGAVHRRLCQPPAAARRRGRPRGRAAVRGRARPHRSAGRGPGPGTGPDDQPRGPGLQRNQQRHLPRCARHRPRRAGAGTARHHRRGLGLRARCRWICRTCRPWTRWP